MSETRGNVFDPFGPWREMRDGYMETWSKAMIDAVNSDAYAAATGAMLDQYLAASMPFRQALEKAMTESLQQLGMPSRENVTALAERLTNLEMRLDDMDAALQRIERMLTELAGTSGKAVGGTPKTPPRPAGKGGR